MKKLIVSGAGGHAKVIIEIVRAANDAGASDAPKWEIAGCVGMSSTSDLLGAPVLGGDEVLADLLGAGEPKPGRDQFRPCGAETPDKST